ncbi:DUF1822 family protein [Lusitaniella coriacea]|uniref:DUF1822 family protein n=1 Tax=Lusitaniella coriacea TaxID=1983105 RepID=UPI003CF2C79D
MNNISCNVSLSLEAHARAKRFQRYHTNPQKAKQVYLNTLAVYAVDNYLQCQGFETDWVASDSTHPVFQALMDIADLKVKDCGKIECRPVLPNSDKLYIPPEVWAEIGDERRGYVAVQFTESLREATLLGFVDKVEAEELSLSELQSIEQLSKSLNQYRELAPESTTVNLGKWFQEVFAKGWQSVNSLFEQERQELAFRDRQLNSALRGNLQLLRENAVLKKDLNSSEPIPVRGIKLLDVGMELEHESVAMLVGIAQEKEEKMGVRVRLLPTEERSYLPQDIKLSLLSSSNDILQESQARDRDNMIQLKRFTCPMGESFSVRVSLGECTLTENFAIDPISFEKNE